MSLSTRPLFAVAAFSLIALLLTLTAAPEVASAAAKANAQKKVVPGKKVKLRVKSFPRRSRVLLFLQPTRYRGGNGFGITLKRKIRLPKRGRGLIRFRMPKSYFACAGATDCNRKKWRRRSRVDITVCTINKRVPKCAIAETRIR